MAVKVITDSASDISQEEAQKMGVTVVPLYLRFGDTVYRDGVDIDCDEFYYKLETEPKLPTTSSPSPGDFARIYQEASRESDEIVSIHLTSRHSATFRSAQLGSELAALKGCRIEVIDSKAVTALEGLAARVAAEAAMAQLSLQQVVERVQESISRITGLALLDTMSYIVKGGRLGRAVSRVESLLNIKPLLTLKEGQIHMAGMVRTRKKGLERLRQFIETNRTMKDFSIAYSTEVSGATKLAEMVRERFPSITPKLCRIGPALGVHGGPGAVIAAVRI